MEEKKNKEKEMMEIEGTGESHVFACFGVILVFLSTWYEPNITINYVVILIVVDCDY